MSEERTFTAGEAASITGVGQNTQLDWRRRGFLPSGEGRWTRFTLRDLCRLRLIAAFIAAGLPVGVSVELVDQFLDAMHGCLLLAMRQDPSEDATLAVFARWPNGAPRSFTSQNLDSLAYGLTSYYEDKPMIGFQSAIILNLTQLARAMNAAIRERTP